MDALHSLMDEKVNVYEENKRFGNLLSEYYKTRNSEILTEMWPLAFRCASNILKRRFGEHKGYEWISDTAIGMCEVIMGRIADSNKYPDGYKITNLPTVLKYSIMNVLYGPEKKRSDDMDRMTDVDECYDIEDERYASDDGYVVLSIDDKVMYFDKERIIDYVKAVDGRAETEEA